MAALAADFHPALSNLSTVADRNRRFLMESPYMAPCWLKGGTLHLLHLWFILIGCRLSTHLGDLQRCKVCLKAGNLVIGGWDVCEDSRKIPPGLVALERFGRLRWRPLVRLFVAATVPYVGSLGMVW